jgi:hypothetical protein
VGRRIAFERRTEPKDDFFNPAAACVSFRFVDSIQQAGDRQILRTDSAERVQSSGQNVIQPTMKSRRFHAHEISRLLYHENTGSISPLIGADPARLNIGQLPAALTAPNSAADITDSRSQRRCLFWRRLEEMKRKPCCGPASNPRHPLKALDQPFDRLGIGAGCH